MPAIQSLPAIQLKFQGYQAGACREKDKGRRTSNLRPLNPKSELAAQPGELHAAQFNFSLSAKGGSRPTHTHGVENVSGEVLVAINDVFAQQRIALEGTPHVELTRVGEPTGQPANLEARYALRVTCWTQSAAHLPQRLPTLSHQLTKRLSA